VITLVYFFLTFISILSLVFFFNSTLAVRFTIFKEIEIRFLASLVTLAILGFLSIFLPGIISGIINVLILSSVAIFGLYKSNWSFPEFIGKLFPRNLLGPLLAWILLGILACGASNLSFSQQENLPDGPYVFKSWTKNVQVQWASGDLPADNSLSYFAGEFLVRHVDLEKVHPFLPGQEIVLRTFAVPFIYLTFRSFDFSAPRSSDISYFDYVGTSWPNAMDFYSDHLYQVYTGVSVALQSFFVFALMLLASRNRRLWKNGVPAALLLGIFPFFMQQTYFTWTKSLCTAFALLAVKMLIENRYLASGLLMAFSYQIHPMALIYFLSIMLYVIIYKRDSLFYLLLPFLSGYVLWQIWVKSTGLRSDLIEQNFSLQQPIVTQIFARVTSVYNFINPSFLNSYPPLARSILFSWVISAFPIALAFGATVLLQTKLKIKLFSDEKALIIIGLISFLIAVLIQSNPSMVIFFGGQLLVSIVLVLAIRSAESWRIYLPWMFVFCMGILLWARVTKPFY